MAHFRLRSLWHMAVVALLPTLCGAGSGRAAESDWPMWRCDAGRTAASAVELPAPLYVQWKREFPPPRPAFPHDSRLHFDGTYEPVVLGQRIFVPSMVTDTVTAYDTASGERVWTFFADAPVRFAPIAWEDRVFFVSDDGGLYCVTAEEGRLLWKCHAVPRERTPYKLLGNERLIARWPARGGPVLRDGRVYFAAGVWPFEGVFIAAVNARTGQLIWVNKEGAFLKDGLLDHGDRRDGGLSPQGYLAVSGERLIVPSGRALPALLNRQTGQLEPYTTGWGGRVALAKGCWYACGTEDFLFQSGDVYRWAPASAPVAPLPQPGELVSLSDLAQQMQVPLQAVEQWIKGVRLDIVERDGQHFIRLRNRDPISFLSWWTYDKSHPMRPGERHALQTHPRWQIDPDNGKALGVFREPVVAGDMIYYSCARNEAVFRVNDIERRPPKTGDDRQIVACRLTGSPRWEMAYQGGWSGRLVPWPVARFDQVWSLLSPLKVHIKAGQRLYGGGAGVVAAVDPPAAGQEPKVSWQARIEGTPNRMLAADGKLFVVTSAGTLYCLGPRQGEVRIHAATPSGPAASSDVWKTRAAQILRQSGVTQGYCLALGLGTGRLVEELAHQSELHVIVLESNRDKVAAARLKYHALGLYGARVHILPGDLSSLRLPPFLASLVVSEDGPEMGFEQDNTFLERLFASLRPCGGVAYLALSESRHAGFSRRVQQVKLAGAQVARVENLTVLTRAGALPDSSDWPHESGDAAHTFASRDQWVRPPFGVLWFAGSADRICPSLEGPPPRIAYGRMVLRIGSELHVVDIYTGRHLWKRSIKGLGDFVAADNGIYVVSGKDCLRLDPATGAQAGVIRVPSEAVPEKGLAWRHIRIWGDSFFGTAGKYLLCLDRRRGELRWKLAAQRDGFTFAVGGNRVFSVDSWLPIHRRRGEPATEEATIAAVDVHSGQVLWRSPATVPADDAFRTAREGFQIPLDPQVAFAESSDIVLFTRNRSTASAYRGVTGELLWSRDIPCKDPPGSFTAYHPPIVLPGRLISHPGEVIDLFSGSPRQERLWKGINAQTRGCGRALGGPHVVTVRDGHASYFELATGSHVSFRGIRSGCINSLIPAGGILNAPNFARHCTCNYPISASLGLVWMPEAAEWGGAGSASR